MLCAFAPRRPEQALNLAPTNISSSPTPIGVLGGSKLADTHSSSSRPLGAFVLQGNEDGTWALRVAVMGRGGACATAPSGSDSKGA